MAGNEMTTSLFLVTFLLGLLNFPVATSQNLSKYYDQPCNPNLQQCNKDMPLVTTKFVYVLLYCRPGEDKCLCPSHYSLNGKKLNATGYEWREEKAQCLMSLNSQCTGLAKDLCASGNCTEGVCVNSTITRDIIIDKPGDVDDEGSILHCGVFSTALSVCFQLAISLFSTW